MNLAPLSRRLTAFALCTTALAAQAHGGHGAAQVHWHATDTVGLLVVGVLAGLALWFARGK